MKRLKKITLCLFVACLVFLPFNSAFAKEAFTIDKYNIDMKVNTDNSYNITETIYADFGNNERHGIYRSIPTQITAVRTINGARDEKTYYCKIKDIEVNKDFSTENESGYRKIQIGSEDYTVTGKQKYVISYKYVVGNDKITDFDDLYYNLIGDQWNTTIDKVNFTIEMPSKFNTKLINFTSGLKGSTNNTNVVYSVKGKTVTGHTINKLGENEALTVRIELPEGYYTDVSSGIDYLGIGLIILSAIFLIVSMIQFFMYGRDEKPIESIEFYPPEDLTPGEVGYIYDEFETGKLSTSTIISLASKGYMKIKEVDDLNTPSSIEFIKTKDADDKLKTHETAVYNGIFSHGDNVNMSSLEYEFNDTAMNARSYIEDSFTGEKSVASKTGNRQILLGIVLGILAIVVNFFISVPYEGFSEDMMVNAFVSVWFIFALVAMIYTCNTIQVKKTFWRYFFLGLETLGAVIVALILALLVLGETGTMSISMITSGLMILSAFFIGFLYKRSDYRTRIMGRINGFRDFLIKTKKDEIEKLCDENPNYYFDVLPYMYVLNISEKYMKKFDGLIKTRPDWYIPYGRDPFWDYYMMSSFFGHMDRMNTTATSVEPSSDSGGFAGGGGFSGGGFGGGGGGSW